MKYPGKSQRNTIFLAVCPQIFPAYPLGVGEGQWKHMGQLWLPLGQGSIIPWDDACRADSQPWGCVGLDALGLWGLSCLSTAQGALEVTLTKLLLPVLESSKCPFSSFMLPARSASIQTVPRSWNHGEKEGGEGRGVQGLQPEGLSTGNLYPEAREELAAPVLSSGICWVPLKWVGALEEFVSYHLAGDHRDSARQHWELFKHCFCPWAMLSPPGAYPVPLDNFG